MKKIYAKLKRMYSANLDVRHDQLIDAGAKWKEEITTQLNKAQVFILLISEDFLQSKYINRTELRTIYEREKEDELIIFPVILEDCNWKRKKKPKINELQFLPRNENPVYNWPNLNEALNHICEEIKKTINKRVKTFSAPKEDNQENLIPVKGAVFTMGKNSPSQKNNLSREVEIKSFYLGKYPVTVGQFNRYLMEKNQPLLEGDNKLPATQVSWLDAVHYCNWLSDKKGLAKAYKIYGARVTAVPNSEGYRLPSEAEWEFAARGGVHQDPYRFSGSDDVRKVAWSVEDKCSHVQPVGRKDPNGLGLYDMSGNVREWCADCWHNTYDYGPKTGEPWMSGGNETVRILRGGSFSIELKECECTCRGSEHQDRKDRYTGFRIARSIL